MPYLRESGTDSTGAEISDASVQFLRAHLETISPEATLFYIDAPSIEILAEEHAPSLLINRLREVLNRRECCDIELIGAAPATAEELAGIIERRTNRAKADAARDAAEAGRHVVADEKVQNAEESDDDAADPVESDEAFIGQHQLKCVVCKEKQFLHRRAPLRSATAGSPATDWMTATANCYVCSSCGYMHWFMP